MTEADNAARCAANLASPKSRVRGHVRVPTMQRDLCSARVLTMEYVQGDCHHASWPCMGSMSDKSDNICVASAVGSRVFRAGSSLHTWCPHQQGFHDMPLSAC